MKILFQGDSITDMHRDRSDYHNLGDGYPKYAAANMKEIYKDVDFEFIDLGISGNETDDLVARLEKDFIEIQPDIVSILIGINDVWHHAEGRKWVPNDVFENNYETVLKAIKERTNAKIMMIEPFLIPGTEKDYFREDLDPKILIERKLARKYADLYVALDGILASEYLYTDPKIISADGVHPTPEGAKIIGKIYADAIGKLIK